MKKLLIVALSLVAVFAFAGCSGSQASTDNQVTEQTKALTPQEYLDEIQPLVLNVTGSFKNELGQMLDIVMDGNTEKSSELYQKVEKSCDAVINFKGTPKEANDLQKLFVDMAKAEKSAASNLYSASKEIKTNPKSASEYINDGKDDISAFDDYTSRANDALTKFKNQTGASL